MTRVDDLAVSMDDVARVQATFLPEPEPELLWCPIISVDDHLVEPLNLFEGRVASRLVDRVPQVTTSADGLPFWDVEGKQLPITNVNASVGRPRSEWTSAPQRFDEFRLGTYDAQARLADMNLVGTWAQLGFASVLFGFAGTRFSEMADAEAGLAALQAYNAWVIDDWCAAAPDRLIAMQLPWLADPVVAADEIRKNAERGFRAVSFSENPEALGFGSIHTDEWVPFFAACEETDTVINLHVGSSGTVPIPSKDSPHETVSALFPVNGIIAAVDWIFARVPVRFPGIKIALSEAGVTWVPMVAERLRRAYRGQDVTKRWLSSDPEPVELLFRNFWFTSIEDPAAFEMLDRIGVDRVMVETDYPHYDTTWPHCQSMIRSELATLPVDQIEAVCWRNAAELYRTPQPPPSWLEHSLIRGGSGVTPVATADLGPNSLLR